MKIKLDFKKEQLIDIPLDNGSKSGVYGKLIQFDFIPDFKFTIHEYEFPETKWVVSELSTGMQIVYASSRAMAITLAKQKLEKHKEKFVSIMNNAIKVIKKQGFRFPINEIEEDESAKTNTDLQKNQQPSPLHRKQSPKKKSAIKRRPRTS